jgi:hypothetical protein
MACMPGEKDSLWETNRGEVAKGFYRLRDVFKVELERAGPTADKHECHCGSCGANYARCLYRSPLHIGHVLTNARMTGAKSAASVAAAMRDFPSDPVDSVLSLGHGAGSCLLGVRLVRPLPPAIFGVETEQLSTRVALELFPNLRTATKISDLPQPEGNLLVLSGLVFNEVDQPTSDLWFRWLSTRSRTIRWIDVGRIGEHHTMPLESMRRAKAFIQFHTSEVSGYVCRGFSFTT